MKHHRADQENKQWPVFEQCECSHGFALFVSFPAAARPLVINLFRADDEQHENGRKSTGRHEDGPVLPFPVEN